MYDFLYQLENSLPQLLFALILIAVALLIAFAAKTIVKRLVSRSRLEQKLSSSGEKTSIAEMTGNLAFLLVLLFFLPGILSNLGLGFISDPFSGMLTSIYSYIPNILGAILILVFGFILAKLVKDLSSLFFRKAGTDAYMKKLGIGAREVHGGEPQKFSEVLGMILYFVILIPVIVSALNILNISVISTPAVSVLNSITAMIPLVLAAAVIIIIGVFLAKLAAELIYSITSVSGISEALAENLEDASPYRLNLAKILSELVRYIIIAIFAVQALKVLKLDLLDRAGTALLLYIPNLLSALVILAGGYILASLAKKFVKNTFPGGTFAGVVTRWVIMGLVFLIALSRLGLATEFIMPLYWLTLAAIAVAGALSFGLGGRDFAREQLHKLSSSMDTEGLEKTKMKIVSLEEERERNLGAELSEAKKEHDRRTEETMSEIKKREEEYESARKELEEERIREEMEKKRKEEEEKRRIEEEKRRIEEERIRREEERKKKEEEERLRREEERRRREEERRRREEERRKAAEEERIRREKERKLKEEERLRHISEENKINNVKASENEGIFKGDSFQDEPAYARKDNDTLEPPKLPETEKPEDFVRNFTSDKNQSDNKSDTPSKDKSVEAGFEVKSGAVPEAENLKKSAQEEAEEKK